MKLQVSNSNVPNWRDMTVKSDLPSKLKPLEKLSKNLWWVWNSDAKSLFRDLNPDLWRATGENPVMLLQRLSSERQKEIINDPKFMERIEHVYGMFQDYMKKPMRKDVPSVSYFSMEYGLCNCLKIYSGGLGVLAGDFGISMYCILMVVAWQASLSYMLPLDCVPILTYSAGYYKMSDMVKVGWIPTVVLVVLTSTLLPALCMFFGFV